MQKLNCRFFLVILIIFNVYGDTNQLLFKNRGIEKWEQLSDFNLKGFKLNINYRNISQITHYCNRVLSPLNMEAMGVEGEDVKEIIISQMQDYINEDIYVIVKDRNVLNLLPIKDYNFVEKKSDNINQDNKVNSQMNILDDTSSSWVEDEDFGIEEEDNEGYELKDGERLSGRIGMQFFGGKTKVN